MPPLRERLDDLERLVELFLREGKAPPVSLERGVLDSLRELPWPGNVRELKNFLTRLSVEDSESISLDAVDQALFEPQGHPSFPEDLLAREALPDLKNRVERDYLLFHLRRLHGDVKALSHYAGMNMKHCYRRLKKLGIRVKEERGRRGDKKAP